MTTRPAPRTIRALVLILVGVASMATSIEEFPYTKLAETALPQTQLASGQIQTIELRIRHEGEDSIPLWARVSVQSNVEFEDPEVSEETTVRNFVVHSDVDEDSELYQALIASDPVPESLIDLSQADWIESTVPHGTYLELELFQECTDRDCSRNFTIGHQRVNASDGPTVRVLPRLTAYVTCAATHDICEDYDMEQLTVEFVTVP